MERKIIEQHDYEHNRIMVKYPELKKEDIYSLDKCTPHYHSAAVKTVDCASCLRVARNVCICVCCFWAIPALVMTMDGTEFDHKRTDYIPYQTNVYTYKLDMTKLPPNIMAEINEK
jgi:hypothetical protein